MLLSVSLYFLFLVSLMDGLVPSPSFPAYNTPRPPTTLLVQSHLWVPYFDTCSRFKRHLHTFNIRYWAFDKFILWCYLLLKLKMWVSCMYDKSFYTIGTRESHAPEIWAYFMHNVIESEWLDRVGGVVCHPQFLLPLVPSWWQRR